MHGQSFVLSLSSLPLYPSLTSGGMASNHTAEKVCGHHLHSLIAAVHNATGQIKGPRGGYESGEPKDGLAGNDMSSTEWASIKHTKEFASRVRVRDTSVGYSALDVYIVVFLPLISYGCYLLYCETCRSELIDVYPQLVLTAVHEMTS